MAKRTHEPKLVKAEDLDPRHDWSRPLLALGQMAVDFEERVNFRRLHDYRLARTREALAKSDLGAILTFDQHNIRYISSTVIGEWARDKLTRYCLLTGNGDPYVWDFGSAAKHHRLYAPWLHPDHCRAGLLGLRGAVHPKVGLFEARGRGDQGDPRGGGRRPNAARRRHGRAPHALRARAARHQGARRPAGHARRARDQEPRRAHAAQHLGGDGRRHLPAHRRGLEAGRAGEPDRGACQSRPLREGLGLRRGHQRDLRRALLAAPAQLHRPAPAPGRPGLLRHHPVLHGLPHLLLPHLQRRPRDTRRKRTPTSAHASGSTPPSP